MTTWLPPERTEDVAYERDDHARLHDLTPLARLRNRWLEMCPQHGHWWARSVMDECPQCCDARTPDWRDLYRR